MVDFFVCVNLTQLELSERREPLFKNCLQEDEVEESLPVSQPLSVVILIANVCYITQACY